MARKKQPEPIDPELRVVVVDDDPQMRRTHGRVLRSHGLGAKLMADPIDALAFVAAEPPSVMIVDLALPQMSGLELASRVRSLLHPCPPSIVLVSARASELSPREAALFDVIHSKPYAVDRFVRDVMRAARSYAERASAASDVVRKPGAIVPRDREDQGEG